MRRLNRGERDVARNRATRTVLESAAQYATELYNWTELAQAPRLRRNALLSVMLLLDQSRRVIVYGSRDDLRLVYYEDGNVLRTLINDCMESDRLP